MSEDGERPVGKVWYMTPEDADAILEILATREQNEKILTQEPDTMFPHPDVENQ